MLPNTISRITYGICMAACVLGTSHAEEASLLASNSALAAAMEQYDECHWQAAFDGLSRLADGGHIEAARIATLMFRNNLLYGQTFDVDPARVQSWLDTATQSTARRRWTATAPPAN